MVNLGRSTNSLAKATCCFEQRRPTALTDNDTLNYLPVQQKFIEPNDQNQQRMETADGNEPLPLHTPFIEAFDQESGFTEFDRKKKDAATFTRLSDTVLVRAAGGDLSGPKSQAGAVRLAIQKVRYSCSTNAVALSIDFPR